MIHIESKNFSLSNCQDIYLYLYKYRHVTNQNSSIDNIHICVYIYYDNYACITKDDAAHIYYRA